MSNPLFNNLLILGVGLMGGSLGLAVRRAGLAEKVTGWSRRQQTLDTALTNAVVDSVEPELETALAAADCVVVATPTQLAESLIVDVVRQVDRSVIVTDVASVKGNLARALQSEFGELPANVVLGHPICGSEQSGVAAARENLYRSQKVILIDDQFASPQSLQKVSELWTGVGAIVHTMTLEQHDRTLALTSHLPHMLSFALMNQLAGGNGEVDVFAYSGGGFRDFTRIAGSDPTMWREIALANRDELITAVSGFISELEHLQQLISSEEGEQLQDLIERARQTRETRLPNKS